MPISDTGCLFIHIPKCGGTSIEIALGVADRYPKLGIEPTTTEPDANQLFGGGLQHHSIREINIFYNDTVINKKTFSFCIIRSPIERYASFLAWQYYRFQLNPPSLECAMRSIEHGLSELNYYVAHFSIFSNPYLGALDLKSRKNPSLNNSSFRKLIPQCAYIYEKEEIGVEKIFLFSEMMTVERHLRELGHWSRPLEARMNNSYTRIFLNAISSRQRNRLNEIYKCDLDLLQKFGHSC
jgi:hypothetical protein